MPDRRSDGGTGTGPQLAWRNATAIGPPKPGSRPVPTLADVNSPVYKLFQALKSTGLTDALGVNQPDQAGVPPGGDLHELLGELFNPSKGSGLPKRIRMTSYDPNPESPKINFHGADKGEPFEASPTQFRQLLSSGELMKDAEGAMPEGTSVSSMVRKLLSLIKE